MDEHACGLCGDDTGTTICDDCAKRWTNDLAWLCKIGMPTLRQVAYRQVRLNEATPRHGNTASAPTPLLIAAEQTYIDVERDLQYTGGLLALRPFGWDAQERRRSLKPWNELIPLLVHYMPRLQACVEAAEWAQACTDGRRRVAAYVERRPERKLVGVCPDCEPERTPIYAAAGERYVVCPNCAAFLDVTRVREHYLDEAGMLHITRKTSDAARWVSRLTGIHVTGRDLKNWRARGLVKPNHVEGEYWEWDLKELAACVTRMKTGE